MQKKVQPEILYFKEDVTITNSKYPVLIYSNIFTESGETAADWLEKRFFFNHWKNSWRWGIYDFDHYHANTHEVLGVFNGTAALRLGGENGETIDLAVGSIVVIPAGVAHKCLSHSDDFAVVGAYPEGMEPEMNRVNEADPKEEDQNSDEVPCPKTDPLLGKEGGLRAIWK